MTSMEVSQKINTPHKKESLMMVEVQGTKVNQAFVVFKKAYNSGWREARAPFKKLVYIEHFNRHFYILTQDEADRVEAMIGPHGHAYCKALIAKGDGV